MKTKRAVLVAPKRFEIIETELDLLPGQVIAKIASCGLCTWELNHWRGELGACPLTLGHEWGGTVAEVGHDVKTLKVGDRFAALPVDQNGFSEYAVIPEPRCFPVNTGVDVLYALGEPLKCVVTVLRAAAPEAGDVGVVFGCGPMGLWCIQALSGHYLSALIAFDVDANKLELARKFGATHCINSGDNDPLARLSDITNGRLADFLIEGTGIPSILNEAQEYLRPAGRGRLILMSSHEEPAGSFDFRIAIRKAADIRAAHWRYSQDPLDDMRRAALYLNSGVFNMRDMISHKFNLEDIQTAFETLEKRGAGYIKGIVIP